MCSIHPESPDPFKATKLAQSPYLSGPPETTSKVASSGTAITSDDRKLTVRETGRKVIRLEYEAYTPLALKTMAQILTKSHRLEDQSSSEAPQPASSNSSPSRLIHCAVHHRLGLVPVGEASIVIAVSSPHRREAFRACEYILEEVKLKAQIWKREWYEGDDVEEASWKENFPALRKDGT